jgi:hypothetical protein
MKLSKQQSTKTKISAFTSSFPQPRKSVWRPINAYHKPVTMHGEFDIGRWALDVGRSMFFTLLANLNSQLFFLSLARPP